MIKKRSVSVAKTITVQGHTDKNNNLSITLLFLSKLFQSSKFDNNCLAYFARINVSTTQHKSAQLSTYSHILHNKARLTPELHDTQHHRTSSYLPHWSAFRTHSVRGLVRGYWRRARPRAAASGAAWHAAPPPEGPGKHETFAATDKPSPANL